MVTIILVLLSIPLIPITVGFLLGRISKSRRVALSGAFVGLLAALGFVIAFAKIPAINITLYELIEPEETLYAPGYTERKFKLVKDGMRAEDVARLLGEPLDRVEHPDGLQVWRYTKQGPSDTSYRIRWIELRDHVVSRVVVNFYVD